MSPVIPLYIVQELGFGLWSVCRTSPCPFLCFTSQSPTKQMPRPMAFCRKWHGFEKHSVTGEEIQMKDLRIFLPS